MQSITSSFGKHCRPWPGSNPQPPEIRVESFVLTTRPQRLLQTQLSSNRESYTFLWSIWEMHQCSVRRYFFRENEWIGIRHLRVVKFCAGGNFGRRRERGRRSENDGAGRAGPTTQWGIREAQTFLIPPGFLATTHTMGSLCCYITMAKIQSLQTKRNISGTSLGRKRPQYLPKNWTQVPFERVKAYTPNYVHFRSLFRPFKPQWFR